MHSGLIISAALLLSVSQAHAQTPAPAHAGSDTTINMSLDSSIVKSAANTSGLRDSGRGVVFDASLSQKLPHLLGSSDPMRHIQFLPWVQTTSEQDSGIRINGCENSHNFINIDGIPIYGAQHLLGLFSVFIPSHFEKIDVLSSSPGESRIGGEISLSSKKTVPQKTTFDFSVGLMEADMTLGVPLGRKAAIYASARRSYLNLLYGNLISIDGTPFKYGLFDTNLTGVFSVGDKDLFQADFYFGKDDMGYAPSSYALNIDGSWGNMSGGLSWKHTFDHAKSNVHAYCSRYGSDTGISLSSRNLGLPSKMMGTGLRASFDFNSGFSAGINYSWYRIEPQAVNENVLHDSLEGSLWAAQRHEVTYWFNFSCMLKGECYRSPEHKFFWGISPSFEMNFILPGSSRITVNGGLNHQYLFQTGVSNINLPLEFWLPAGKYSDPQQSLEAALSYKCDIAKGLFSISSEIYCKRLKNQLEYSGDLLSMTSISYDMPSHLMRGRGINYGASVLFRKNTGKLTGWISYTFSRARRRFDSQAGDRLFPSSHERPHELKLLAIYSIGRWDLSGTFVCASGTPFTPVRSFYLISGRLMCNYGDYNSARLPAYVRLDLSATLYLKDTRTNGFNFSIYNATFSKNPVMYRLTNHLDNNSFSYSPLSLVMFCLPSVSYFHKF